MLDPYELSEGLTTTYVGHEELFGRPVVAFVARAVASFRAAPPTRWQRYVFPRLCSTSCRIKPTPLLDRGSPLPRLQAVPR